MKSERGITLTSLVIYVIVATIAIGIIAVISSTFFSNMNYIREEDTFAQEFNKFCMFFIEDCKNNNSAEVTDTKITFNSGTSNEIVYEYKASEKAIYRNTTKIAQQIQNLDSNEKLFSSSTVTISNTDKQIISVHLRIGANVSLDKTIEFVLKYW